MNNGRLGRHRWSAVLATLIAGGLAVVPAPARANDTGLLDPVAGAVSELLSGDGVASYWTAERMEAAVPLSLDPQGEPTAGTARASVARAATAGTAPRSVGKLFFSDALGDYVCSAATVNSAGRNLIITAGHCVNEGGQSGLLGLGGCSAGDTFDNFLFVPRYANGTGPDGEWVGTRAIMHRQWVEECDAFAYDNALIELAPSNGRRIVDVVGGNGLALDHPQTQTGVNIWGWPAQAPFDGETARRCNGPTAQYADTGTDAAMECDMTGGASGGPWFLSMATPQLGFIWAVTSRRTIGGTPYLLAVPLTREVLTLFAATGVTRPSTVTISDTSLASVTASRPGLALRATPSRVGRGQVLSLRMRARANTRVYLAARFLPSGTWRRVAVRTTNSSGIATVAYHAAKAGVREYRLRSSRRSVLLRVRVLPCPMPLDRSVADDTTCTRPTA